MKRYTFSEENARKLMKSQTIARLPLIAIAIFGGLYISNYRSGGSTFGNPIVLSFTLLICAIAVSIGLIFGIKNGTKNLMQNVYQFTDDSIKRHTPSGKSISINFNEVTDHKLSKAGFLIKSKNQKMLIPSSLDEYDELSGILLSKIK
jgi:hypothetical protein